MPRVLVTGAGRGIGRATALRGDPARLELGERFAVGEIADSRDDVPASRGEPRFGSM